MKLRKFSTCRKMTLVKKWNWELRKWMITILSHLFIYNADLLTNLDFPQWSSLGANWIWALWSIVFMWEAQWITLSLSTQWLWNLWVKIKLGWLSSLPWQGNLLRFPKRTCGLSHSLLLQILSEHSLWIRMMSWTKYCNFLSHATMCTKTILKRRPVGWSRGFSTQR